MEDGVTSVKVPVTVAESAKETPEAEALVMVKLLNESLFEVMVCSPWPSSVSVPLEWVKVAVELLVKLEATEKEAELEAMKVALAELVKEPLIFKVGSFVSALSNTPLVPSPLTKFPSTLIVPEAKVYVGDEPVGLISKS